MSGTTFPFSFLFLLLSLAVSLPIFFVLCQPLLLVISSALSHTVFFFILHVPVARWAPAVLLWTATSSHWRSVWCVQTWRETLCSGPVDTSPPAPCAHLVWRSVSSARIRSSQEPRYQKRYYYLSHLETGTLRRADWYFYSPFCCLISPQIEECVVCSDKKAAVLFQPCGHMCACESELQFLLFARAAQI